MLEMSIHRSYDPLVRVVSHVAPAAVVPLLQRWLADMREAASVLWLRVSPSMTNMMESMQLAIVGLRRCSLIFPSFLEKLLMIGEVVDEPRSSADLSSGRRLPQEMRMKAIKFRCDFEGLNRWDVIASLIESSTPSRARVVEVGVGSGRTSAFLLNHFSDLRILGVDPYSTEREHNLPQAEKIYAAHRDRARLLRSTSAQAVQDEQLSRDGWDVVDLVFIDARKGYESQVGYIQDWSARIREGGCLCGHDAALTYPGLVEAVLALAPSHRTLHFGPADMWWWCT
eukprot:TRINITY_DN75045_c0_g1_i1.p1 TRINITY_DN75045_c0_g1~~TRINITY_DN75045_c0_g1_i1.p1  ORF type:complete len:284 (+),score=20.54 TRINITY_DN75045_c0_g1_i1:178-1029(+)